MSEPCAEFKFLMRGARCSSCGSADFTLVNYQAKIWRECNMCAHLDEADAANRASHQAYILENNGLSSECMIEIKQRLKCLCDKKTAS